MATLYWGGGSGTWDGFTTTNWYTDLARTVLSTRAPSAEDDVIFDSSSNPTAYTVTVSNNTTVCRTLTVSGPASGSVTFAGSGQFHIYGNFVLPASGITWNATGQISFYGANNTITTNGVALKQTLDFIAGSSYTLQDALTTNGNIFTRTTSTLNTNNNNLTCAILSFTGNLTLGSSTIVATEPSWSGNPGTLNAGTSNITFTSFQIGFGNTVGDYSNTITFYNVTLTGAFAGTTSTYCFFVNPIVFNNLTFPALTSAQCQRVSFYNNITVNGTLTIAGQLSVRRYFLTSADVGTAKTLTVNAVAALVDVDFQDITVAGASSPWSGTRLGDCKGNTNITFGAGANKYIAAATGSNNWSANIWSTASGGTAATADFPLAQDTVIIDNAGLNTGATLTANAIYNVGAIDASSRTNAMTYSASRQLSTYGDVNVSTNVTISGTAGFVFAGKTTQNLTTNGKTAGNITVSSPGGTLLLADNLTASTISVLAGTFNANNKNITCTNIQSTGSLTRTLTLGSGTITTTSGVFSTSTVSNLTVSSTTATITLSSSGTLGFAGLSATLNGAMTVSGVGSNCTIAGPLTVASLTLTAPTATAPTDKLVLNDNLTVTGTLAMAGGTSVTQRAFVRSNTLGTQRTLSAATVTGLTDIDFRDVSAAGAGNWTVGTRLGDCGNNAGITFPATKTVYWNLAGTQDWSATGWSAVGSGGTPAVNDFPLAQDTAVFDNTGSAGTVTLNAAWNIGTVDASTRTSAMTLSGSGAPNIYGSVTYASGITASNTGTFNFVGRGTQTFSTAGKSLSNALTVNKPAGTFQHGDAYTSNSAVTITLGTYTTQNYNVTASGLSSSNSNARSITLGTSTLTMSGTTPVTFTTSTNLTFSGASSTINLSSTSAKTFAGGGQTFGTVSSTGGTTNPLTITGSNTFTTFTNSARTYLIFTASLVTGSTTQTITNFTYSGEVGSVVRVYTSVAGQRATLATGGTGWGFGANSTNGGNNVGVALAGTTPDYLYVKDINYTGPNPYASSSSFLMFFN